MEAAGTIVPSPAKGQPFEMQASAIKVIGWVDDPDTYPIHSMPHSLEFLREVAHLPPRTSVIAAATRVRHSLAQTIQRFFVSLRRAPRAGRIKQRRRRLETSSNSRAAARR